MTTKEKLLKVMHFDEDILELVAVALDNGNSVVLLTELYFGNGKWKLDKYRYKMIVPSVDKNGLLYSTDVFDNVSSAVNSSYEIYMATRQNALEVVKVVQADLSEKRYGFGYTKEAYGQFPLK